jgi:hypothetical protein
MGGVLAQPTATNVATANKKLRFIVLDLMPMVNRIRCTVQPCATISSLRVDA